MRELCDANGILLVFDEVITGWGRTGQPFAAQTLGVTPDLITMAKAITNGAQPMGAVAVKRAIHDAIVERGPLHAPEFFHGYTYSAHPAACAAGLATLALYAAERSFEQARARSRPTSKSACSRSAISLPSPTCAASACSPASTCARRTACRASRATRCRSASSTPAST